jgi:hypothetical protein
LISLALAALLQASRHSSEPNRQRQDAPTWGSHGPALPPPSAHLHLLSVGPADAPGHVEHAVVVERHAGPSSARLRALTLRVMTIDKTKWSCFEEMAEKIRELSVHLQKINEKQRKKSFMLIFELVFCVFFSRLR